MVYLGSQALVASTTPRRLEIVVESILRNGKQRHAFPPPLFPLSPKSISGTLGLVLERIEWSQINFEVRFEFASKNYPYPAIFIFLQQLSPKSISGTLGLALERIEWPQIKFELRFEFVSKNYPNHVLESAWGAISGISILATLGAAESLGFKRRGARYSLAFFFAYKKKRYTFAYTPNELEVEKHTI